MEARIASLKNEGEALPTGAAKVAGDAFGSRFEKSNNKKQWILCYMFWKIVRAVCKKLYYWLTCIYTNMYKNMPICRIIDITTSAFRISQTKQTMSKSTSDPFHGHWKIDIYDNNTVTGKNWVILKYIDRSLNVAPFSEKKLRWRTCQLCWPQRDIHQLMEGATSSCSMRNYIWRIRSIH